MEDFWKPLSGDTPRLQTKLQSTLAPVWEANHVWLIAVVVILFVGYPLAYTTLSIYYFVPIQLALLAIILRGAFFTFRKYDPDPEKHLFFYSLLFRISSALAPTMYGLMVGGLLVPMPTQAEASELGFAAMYLQPWLHPISLLCALFVNALFGFLASVFFWGELESDADRVVLRSRVLGFFAATFFIGGLVLFAGLAYHLVQPEKILSYVQIEVQVFAFGGILWMLRALKKNRTWSVRFAAGLQTLAILTGWAHMRYPYLMSFTDGTHLTFKDAAAPAITLRWLTIGLVIVLGMVLPMFVYLYRVFQKQEHSI